MKVFNASKNVLNASLLVMTALLAMTATVFALEDTKTAIGRGNTKAGDPVDIRSGNQVISEAFGSLPGAMPISVGWMYRGKDDTQGPMGRGTTLSTDLFIIPVGTDTTAVTNAIILVTPGNRRFKFLYGSTDSQGQRIFLDTKDPQFNNLESERYYNQNPGSTGSPDVVVNYSYDFPTHLLKSTSTTGNSSQGITSGTWQYFYNTLDQVSAVSGPDGYESVSLDNYGRANSTTKNGVQTEEFEYDNLDRVTAVNNSRVLASPLGTQTRRVEFGYDSLGRNTGYSSSGMGKSVTYDVLSRVTSDTTAAGSASVTHDYSYDYSGRIYSDKTTYNSAGSTSSFYTDYFSYDTLGRLTGATVRGSTFGYTYDLAGNRLTETKDNVTKGFSYDNANRMLYASIGTQFSSAMSYDGNGNLTQISSTGNTLCVNIE